MLVWLERRRKGKGKRTRSTVTIIRERWEGQSRKRGRRTSGRTGRRLKRGQESRQVLLDYEGY